MVLNLKDFMMKYKLKDDILNESDLRKLCGYSI